MDYAPTDVPTDWNEKKDIEEFTDRFDEEEGDLYERGLDEIERGQAKLDEQLSELLSTLFKPRGKFQFGAIEHLTIPAKIKLARQAPVIKRFPPSSLARLEEDLTRCEAAYRLSDQVLSQCVLTRGDVWLLELADAADYQATAGLLIDESLRCEYSELVSSLGESQS